MQFASIGSGSGGNGTLLACGNTVLLVDCGFTMTEVGRRLQRLRFDPERLSAVLVTHEHRDHASGVRKLQQELGVPVYTTRGTAASDVLGKKLEVTLVHAEQPFTVGDFEVTPVPVPHDAREPVQYVFRAGGRTLGLLTDLGMITPVVRQHYAQCDALLLETNHDPVMLAEGPYSNRLKKRVAGRYGHLNNGQAADLLAGVEQERLQHLIAMHISQKNNQPLLALDALRDVLRVDDSILRAATQDEGFGWTTIH